jgi:kynurenine formamidase
MCSIEIMQTVAGTPVGRRQALALGLGAVTAALLPLGGPAFAQGNTGQSVPGLRIRGRSDLTHTVTPTMPIYPGPANAFFPPRVENTIPREATPIGFITNTIVTPEHTGTHIDAPIHFSAEGIYVDQLPLETLVVPAVVIGIRERAARDPDTVVTPDDIRAWERRHGRLPANACVIMDSGWWQRWGVPQSYLNVDSAGVAHAPGSAPRQWPFWCRSARSRGSPPIRRAWTSRRAAASTLISRCCARLRRRSGASRTWLTSGASHPTARRW